MRHRIVSNHTSQSGTSLKLNYYRTYHKTLRKWLFWQDFVLTVLKVTQNAIYAMKIAPKHPETVMFFI